jgi:thermitase
MRPVVYVFAAFIFSSAALFSQGLEQTKRVILQLKAEVSTPPQGKYTGNEAVDRVSQQLGIKSLSKHLAGRKSGRSFYVLQFPEGANLQEVIEAYYRTGQIAYAEPDYQGSSGGVQGIRPNDQHYARQWALRNEGTFSLSSATVGADISMENAWAIEQGDSSIVVAIIDSGLKMNHPEFAGRIWTNASEIPNNGIDDDGNGYVDDVSGWNFADSNNSPNDGHGHGTNVTGIIGANGDNGIGYAGLDWNCKLMVLKGLDNNNNGLYSWWASAIYYAVDHGARVINMSVGGQSFSTTLQDAVNYAINADVLIVACMMNTNSSTVFYPAGFPGVMAVGATNPNDARANPFFWSPTSGSNYGNHISVSAPGNYIYGLNHNSNTNYNSYWGGTSQAAPHVAGLAALLLAQDPSRTAAEVRSIIESTAEDLVGQVSEDTPGWDPYFGHGRINAHSALSLFTNASALRGEGVPFLIYPNPAHHDFTIAFPTGTREIRIINALGQLVLAQVSDGQPGTKVFQLHAAPGLYYVQIAKGQQTMTQKLIISP